MTLEAPFRRPGSELSRLSTTGVPDEQDLASVCPPRERFQRGRVTILECFQEIPCDPCTQVCPFGAIKPMADINERPSIDWHSCVGCALCLSRCPGLAIFMVDECYSETESLVVLPYELLPLPEHGGEALGLDREGRPVCTARVLAVQDTFFQDRTRLVWLAVPKALAMTVRHCRPLQSRPRDGS